MIKTEKLDVTQIEPRLKHPTIFEHFDALAAGEGFVIHNDHDPKPLYYQLLGERGQIFTWEYLSQGPEEWEVRIAKNKAEEGETVGALAAADYRKAEVFKKMGIDFCCGGNKTLKEASKEAGISEENLKQALDAVQQSEKTGAHDYNTWELDFLADYIANTHHKYVKESAPIINGLAQKVANHHGDHHPELWKLAKSTEHFLNDLLSHVHKEDQVLFPAIKEVVRLKNQQQDTQSINIQAPINQMMKEHEVSGEDLRFFRQLTQDYQLPADACNSYQYLFEKMKEFENDLFEHIHLENNILFPKALQLTS